MLFVCEEGIIKFNGKPLSSDMVSKLHMFIPDLYNHGIVALNSHYKTILSIRDADGLCKICECRDMIHNKWVVIGADNKQITAKAYCAMLSMPTNTNLKEKTSKQNLNLILKGLAILEG